MSGSLIINAGSSSIKFAIFDQDNCVCKGLIEDLNGSNPQFTAKNNDGVVLSKVQPTERPFNHTAALKHLFAWLDTQSDLPKIEVAGHRVVHGGARFTGPTVITPDVLQGIKDLYPISHLHQPHHVSGIEAISVARQDLKQVACFDTSYHQTQDELATLIAIPEKYRNEGVKRYGFHGLSYEYINSQLPNYFPKGNKFIVCHLGNGASLCAIKDGKSIATTMGFTTLDGLIMGTRPGLTDPGVLLYLMDEHGMNYHQILELLYKESGLKAVSCIGNDMRELEHSTDPKAKLAIEAFCYRIVRELGSLVAALQGLDGIVFTGGIGENDSNARSKILTRLAYMGIKFNPEINAKRGLNKLSTDDSSIPVWVIPTDEELVISRHSRKFIGK